MTRAACHDLSAVTVHWWSIGNRRNQYDALTKSVTGEYAIPIRGEFEASIKGLTSNCEW